MHMTVKHLSGLHGQWNGSDLVECMYTQQTEYQDFANCTRPVLLIKAIKYMQCASRTVNALWFTHFSHHHTTYALSRLMTYIYIYIYIYMSFRTANLQMLHFIYLFKKYTYWIFYTCWRLSVFSSSKCRLFHNATFFGSCIIHILNTGCAKI